MEVLVFAGVAFGGVFLLFYAMEGSRFFRVLWADAKGAVMLNGGAVRRLAQLDVERGEKRPKHEVAEVFGPAAVDSYRTARKAHERKMDRLAERVRRYMARHTGV